MNKFETTPEVIETVEKSETPLIKREMNEASKAKRRRLVSRVEADVHNQIEAILAEAARQNKQLTPFQAAEALRTKLEKRYTELTGARKVTVSDVTDRSNVSEMVAIRDTKPHIKAEVKYLTKQLEALRSFNTGQT